MNLKRWLRPAPHLERHAVQHALLVGFAGALALGATVGVAWAAGFEIVLHRLRHFDPFWLPVAFGLEVVAYVGYAVAYRVLVRVDRGPVLAFRHVGAIVAAGFGVFVIRGGFVVDRQALEHAGIPREQARIRVLGLGALEYAVLAPATAVAAVILLARGSSHPSLGFTLPWVIAVPLGAVAAAVALGFRERLHGHGSWRAVLAHGLDAIHVLRRVVCSPRDYGAALLGTVLYWAGDIGCLWAALRCFHGSPPVPALIVGYATGYALTRRTLPLAGAGVVEALVAFALAWAGVPLASALLAVFVYRLFNLWLPLLPAVLGLRSLKRLAAEAARPRPPVHVRN
jgi:uncharacterized membrane protein YbhN (UPF0104 family)